MLRHLSLSPALLVLACASADARTPAAPQQTLTAAPPAVYTLTNVNVQVDARTLLRGSSLTVRNGRIEAVGKAPPADAWLLDLGGKTVMPAFIDPAANYGIKPGSPCQAPVEAPAGPPAGGRRGGGAGGAPSTPGGPPAHWNPRVCPERSLAREFSVDADRAKALRAQGFAVVHTLPDFGNLGGQSVMLALPPSNLPADALIRADVVQHVSLSPAFGFGGVYPGSTMGALALLRQSLYDARWYAAAGASQLPEASPSLQALGAVLDGRQPLLLVADDELDAARIAAVGREFKVRTVVVGTGTEYRNAAALKGMDLVLPLNFPKAPSVADPAKALEINLVDLEHWRYAPFNPKVLADAGVRFSLTARGLEKPEDFLSGVREAVKRGLSSEAALAALTEVPATQFGLAGELGVLKAGARANLLVADADFLANDKAKLYEIWVEGAREVLTRIDAPEWRGDWTLAFAGQASAPKLLKLSGDAAKPKATLDETEVKSSVEGERLLVDAPATLFGAAEGSTARVQLELTHVSEQLRGRQVASTGASQRFSATRSAAHTDKAEDAKPAKALPSLPAAFAYPAGEYGRTAPPAQPKQLLIRGATVWLADRTQPLADTDVLVENGKIRAVGQQLSAGRDAVVIDAAGKHLTPGLIDAHSHIAIDGNVNEPSHTITSEVRIGDVLNPADVSIYRQLAGGVTTAHLLHGSANAIGGQSQVIKLRWGTDAEGLKFAEAAPTIKFALGENPKQSNWGNEFSSRYPQTRMGVEQIIEDAFTQARAYQARMKADPTGTRRDLRYDALVEILEGKRQVHTHSYRADEILAFARQSQRFGFKIAAFQHVLEGYKVAREIAEIGAGASTFADWWSFKLEVYDAIPYNAAMMEKRGVLTSINSDSPDLARRLNTEAAKAVRFGGLSESQALALVTINPARQLRVDQLVGSIEAGKQADLVLWSAHPLSTAARVEQTWIEGRKYFDQAEDVALQARVDTARAELITAALDAAGSGPAAGSGARPGMGRPGVARLYDQVLGQRQWPVELAIRRGPYHNGEPVHICLGAH